MDQLVPPSGFDPDQPSPQDLLWGYRQGLFPMGSPEHGGLDWYCPQPRAILDLNQFHVPRSLARRVRSGLFEIRIDTDFEAVIDACGRLESDQAQGNWITPAIRQAYIGLYQQGHAHSVEAYRDDILVGGLYGVRLGGAFFGESMFSLPEKGGRDASKVALVHLVQRMQRCGYVLLDVQFHTPHLAQFGCLELPRAVYLEQLKHAIDLECDPLGDPSR